MYSRHATQTHQLNSWNYTTAFRPLYYKHHGTTNGWVTPSFTETQGRCSWRNLRAPHSTRTPKTSNSITGQKSKRRDHTDIPPQTERGWWWTTMAVWQGCENDWRRFLPGENLMFNLRTIASHWRTALFEAVNKMSTPGSLTQGLSGMVD